MHPEIEKSNPKMAPYQGQGLVEFALILPFLLLVIFGILDLGRVFFYTIAITSSAREGVRYLTVHPDDITNSLGIFDGTKSAAVTEAGYSGTTITASNVTVSCINVKDPADECDSGKPASVTVDYSFNLILGWVLPSPINLSRSVEMMIP